MAHVTLDPSGSNVTGIFATHQLPPQPPGYAEIDDGDARIAAFQTNLQRQRLAATKRQILIWLLLDAGKTEADVVAALNTISDPTAKAQALIDWNYPDGPMHRDNPLFDQLATLFNMTPTDIDAAFVAAAKL
jgi:hypothetical protein